MAELRNYTPSWRERAKYALADLMGGDREAHRRAETGIGLAGTVLPPFEAALQGNEAYRAAQGGRWGEAAMSTALSAANLTPFAAIKPIPSRMRGILGDNVAYATHEFMPGANTGHMTGLKDNPAASKAFDTHHASTWATAPGGRDEIFTALGIKTEPTRDMQGIYRNSKGDMEFNRGQVALPESKSNPARISEAESFRGYMDAQEGAAWHKLSPGNGDAVRVPIDRRLSGDESRAMSEAMEPHGLSVIDTGGGVTLKDFSFTKTPDDISAAMPAISADVRRALPEARAPFQRSFDGDYIDYSGAWAQPGSGEATRQLRNAISPTDAKLLDASPGLRRSVAQRNTRDRDIAGKHGLPVREDIMRAREIFAKDGLKGLFSALDRGVVLPATVATFMGAGAMSGEGQE